MIGSISICLFNKDFLAKPFLYKFSVGQKQTYSVPKSPDILRQFSMLARLICSNNSAKVKHSLWSFGGNDWKTNNLGCQLVSICLYCIVYWFACVISGIEWYNNSKSLGLYFFIKHYDSIKKPALPIKYQHTCIRSDRPIHNEMVISRIVSLGTNNIAHNPYIWF